VITVLDMLNSLNSTSTAARIFLQYIGICQHEINQ
jgi:hypothetical protein